MLQASILTACMALFLALLFMWTSVQLLRKLDAAKADILSLQELRDSLAYQADYEETLKKDYCQLLRAEENRTAQLKEKLEHERVTAREWRNRALLLDDQLKETREKMSNG